MRRARVLLTLGIVVLFGAPGASAQRGAPLPALNGAAKPDGVLRIAEQKRPLLPDRSPPRRATKRKHASPAKKKPPAPERKPEQETQERTRAEKCAALMGCRALYTKCDNNVYATMKPGPKRDRARDNCVVEYQKCIRANFKTFEMVIIRWLWPGSKCPW